MLVSFLGAIPKAVPHVAEPPKAPMISRPVSEIPVTSPQTPTMSGPVPGERSETRVKMNRMRLRIAQRMKDAQNTYAMLTTFNEVDMRLELIWVGLNLLPLTSDFLFLEVNFF